MKKQTIQFTFFLIVLAAAARFAPAQEIMAETDNMLAENKRPVVVFVRADWCPYCKALEPKMSKLVEQYGDKLKFVTLDITNKEATRKSASIAKDAGLSEFFEANKTKASTVAIFKEKKMIYSTVHETEQRDIAAALKEVIER